MGSFPAATHAAGLDHAALMKGLARVFVDANWPIKPYTLPILSVFSMGRAERALEDVFGDRQIEDLWTSYFCAAADLTSAELKVFREGLLWRAMRASASFPGLFPPVPEGGHLLVDGGVFTNLPIGQMRDLCPGPVIASDVSRDMEMTVDAEMATAPSLGRVLWSRINPFARAIRFPGLSSVLFRAIDAPEAAQRAQVRRAASFTFMPPVAQFGLDQTGALEEIAAIGYEYAGQRIAELPASIAREDDSSSR